MSVAGVGWRSLCESVEAMCRCGGQPMNPFPRDTTGARMVGTTAGRREFRRRTAVATAVLCLVTSALGATSASAATARAGASAPTTQTMASAVTPQTLAFDATAPTLDRIGGVDRYDTAALISQRGWQTSGTVYVASGLNYPDALAGVPLAAINGAPILLTGTDTMPAQTLNEITRLGASNVVLLGGAGVISDDEAGALTNAGATVTRLWGATRYDTAVQIGQQIVNTTGTTTAIVATGLGYADALSIGPVAGIEGWPIVFANATGLPDVSASFLANNHITTVVIVGGTGVVGTNVEDSLRTLGVTTITRVAGADRYGTSAAVATTFQSLFGADVSAATGTGFADALTGGVLSAVNKLPMMLVNPATGASPDETTYTAAVGASRVQVYGGAGALSDPAAYTLVRPASQISSVPGNTTIQLQQDVPWQATVANPYGRTLELQRLSGSDWVTDSSIPLGSDASQTVTGSYPPDVWDAQTSQWRFFLEPTGMDMAVASGSWTVTSPRVFQNPSGWLQLSDTNVSYAGPRGANISPYMNGYRIWMIQQKLGVSIASNLRGMYIGGTYGAVTSWQRGHGFSANGVVTQAQWVKMGFSAASWVDADNYTHPLMESSAQMRGSSRDALVEMMIQAAEQYQGNLFVVGGSTAPGYGVDCSGLVMQALYAIGLNPLPSSSWRHTQSGYDYESAQLWKNPKLPHVASPQRGDLVFYNGPSGSVSHVAIYLGNNQVIESWPTSVRVSALRNASRSAIAGYARPLA